MTSVSLWVCRRCPLAISCWRRFAVVVDLAVEDDPHRAVLVGDGLVPAVQVDDRQPAVAQDRLAAGVQPLIVRTAMADRIGHLLDQARLDRTSRIEGDDAADAAHGLVPRPRVAHPRFGADRPAQHAAPLAQPTVDGHGSCRVRRIRRCAPRPARQAGQSAVTAIATRYATACAAPRRKLRNFAIDSRISTLPNWLSELAPELCPPW